MLQELRNLFESGGYAVYGLLVQEEGETVLALGDCTARHPVYSATKSFTATAAGMLQDAGKWLVDDPLAAYLPREAVEGMTPGKREAFRLLPISRFLTMSVPGYPFRPEGEDWLAFALSCPADYTCPLCLFLFEHPRLPCGPRRRKRRRGAASRTTSGGSCLPPSASKALSSAPTPRAGFTGRPGWNCRWKSFPGWDGSICRMVSGMENASSPEAGQKPPSARRSTPGKGRATAISSGLASGTSRSAANGARNASSIPAASSSSAGKGRCRRRPGGLNGQCGSWSPMGVTAEKL